MKKEIISQLAQAIDNIEKLIIEVNRNYIIFTDWRVMEGDLILYIKLFRKGEKVSDIFFSVKPNDEFTRYLESNGIGTVKDDINFHAVTVCDGYVKTEDLVDEIIKVVYKMLRSRAGV